MLKLIEFSDYEYLFENTYEIYKDDFDYDEHDITITEETLLVISFPDYDDTIEISCKELIQLSKIIDGLFNLYNKKKLFNKN